ncbi:MAG: hypothetical protein ACP5NV_06085 [Candidatus Woesearchaeota archaeon]
MRDKISLIFEFLIIILIIALFQIVRKDILIFAAYTGIYFYIITLKKNSIKYLGLSTVISIIWVAIAQNQYMYTSDMTTLFGLDIYPMLAWSIGLFGAKEIYDYFKPENKLKSFITFTIIFIAALIIIETISYHIIEFKNTPQEIYPGLPICDCIHTPLFMQIYYLTIGPIYYLLTLLLDKFIKKY